jgi:hypothetical protein
VPDGSVPITAAQRRGDRVLVIGPPALGEIVEQSGFPFQAGGEPPEAEVAQIREQLTAAPAQRASIPGNRELFGRLATAAMLPTAEQTCIEYAPALVLRDPCEYASAVVAHRLGIPTAQLAISLAEGEASSIAGVAPALEEHRRGLVEELRVSPYLTRLPATLDPSPFPTTVRFDDGLRIRDHAAELPDWWRGSRAPLVYMTFGTVLGHMSMALLHRPDPSTRRRQSGGRPRGLGDRVRRPRRQRPSGNRAALRRPVRERSTDRQAGAGVLVEASRQLAEEDAPRIAEAITTALARPTYRHRPAASQPRSRRHHQSTRSSPPCSLTSSASPDDGGRALSTATGAGPRCPGRQRP